MKSSTILQIIPLIPLCNLLILSIVRRTTRSRKLYQLITVASFGTLLFLLIKSLTAMFTNTQISKYCLVKLYHAMETPELTFPVSLLSDPLALIMLFVSSLSLMIIFCTREVLGAGDHEVRIDVFFQLLLFLYIVFYLSGTILVSLAAFAVMSFLPFFLFGHVRQSGDEGYKYKLPVTSNAVFDALILSGFLLISVGLNTFEYIKIPRILLLKSPEEIPFFITISTGLVSLGVIGKLSMVPFSRWVDYCRHLPEIIRIILFTHVMGAGMYILYRMYTVVSANDFVLIPILVLGSASAVIGILFLSNLRDPESLPPYLSMTLISLVVILFCLGKLNSSLLLWSTAMLTSPLIAVTLVSRKEKRAFSGVFSGLPGVSAVVVLLSLIPAIMLHTGTSSALRGVINAIWTGTSANEAKEWIAIVLYVAGSGILIWSSVRANQLLSRDEKYWALLDSDFYLLVKKHFYLDVITNTLFVAPLKRIGFGLWTLESVIEISQNRWLPYLMLKWGEISIFFDKWVIDGILIQSWHHIATKGGLIAGIVTLNRKVHLVILMFSLVLIVFLLAFFAVTF